MTERIIHAGAALRRLRRREGLTQAAMAQRLGISASYLTLLERNRRPLTARTMLALVQEFDFDPHSLDHDEAVGGADGLRRRLADARFEDLEIDRADIVEWLAAAPQAAMAFARLYDAGTGEGASPTRDALQLVRSEIERWRNHFPDLDHAAEELADELRLSSPDLGQSLTERLRQRHQIAVRVLPDDVMPDRLRRLDLHARQLQLSEMLAPHSRNFQIATQLAWLERREAIRDLAGGTTFDLPDARRLFERHLAAYFAAALMMPYARFVRACEATGYDIQLLQARFGVSFEQLAHRLTTLQRVGRRGLPFFMAKIDRAGQFSKRFAGASATPLLDGEGSCPLWSAHAAFEAGGRPITQSLALEGSGAGESQWFTIARSVTGPGARMNEAEFAIVLGLEASHARDLANARGVSLDLPFATPIGLGCRRCHRADCRQRAVPPREVALSFSDRERGVAPYSFGRG